MIWVRLRQSFIKISAVLKLLHVIPNLSIFLRVYYLGVGRRSGIFSGILLVPNEVFITTNLMTVLVLKQ